MDDGIKLRAWNLFNALAERHVIDNIVLTKDQWHSNDCVLKSRFRSVRAIRTGYDDTTTSDLGRIYSNQVAREFVEIVAGILPDIIVGVNLSAAPYLPRANDPPVLIDLIDDLGLWSLRSCLAERNVLRKIRKLRWYFQMRHEQRHLLDGANVTVASEVDAESLARVSKSCHVWCIPNGVDVNFFSPGIVGTTSNFPLSLVFTGNMDYPPNVEAVQYFCEDIFPLIIQEFPRLKFYIVGRRPLPAIEDLAKRDGRVVVTGEVADIRPFLAKAAVFVCPMISGTGIKNKILEAWAMAKPVVATSMSLGGLKAAQHENVCIADRPKDFARAVIGLLQNEEARCQLGERARNHVVRHYTWEAQANKLEQLLEYLCQPFERSRESSIGDCKLADHL